MSNPFVHRPIRAMVLSSQDLEPITIVQLPGFATAEWLLQVRRIQFAIQMPLEFAEPKAWDVAVRIVSLEALPLMVRGQGTFILLSHDDELALKLRADLLPGQRQLMHETFERGFCDGLHAMWNAMGGGRR